MLRKHALWDSFAATGRINSITREDAAPAPPTREKSGLEDRSDHSINSDNGI